MRLHFLQHVSFEDPAHILTWAAQNQCTVSGSRLYENAPLPAPSSFDFLVVMGGPMSVADTMEFPWLNGEKKLIESAIQAGKKVLGICLGAQLIADVLGAPVTKNRCKEIGWFPVETTGDFAVKKPGICLPKRFMAFHWHGDTFGIPSGAKHLARSEACENQAFSFGPNVLALQFHLESTQASIEQLINHGNSELIPQQYVQLPGILRSGYSAVSTMNNLLEKLLDTWNK